MAVIKDVAETAGLSVSVVSKYLKNPDSVRPDTKTRIEKAIKELNYVPSAQAQSLRTGRTGMIAVISPNVTNPFFAELFSIIQSQAAKVGYIVVLQTISSIKKTNDEPNERFSTFSSLIRHVDGIIVCFPDDDNVISFLRHQWKKQPIVALNWKADKKADINLLVDVEEGIYKITNYLISIGRKSIGYIGRPRTVSRPGQRRMDISGQWKRTVWRSGLILFSMDRTMWKRGISALRTCINRQKDPMQS